MNFYDYQILITIITGMAGASFGSYLLCVGERLALRKKVVRAYSICPKCRHELSWPDLIPVFSWIFLKGRCRYCGAPIPVRHLFTELLMAAVFSLLYIKFGFSLMSFMGAVLSVFLFTASVCDWMAGTVNDVLFIIPAIIWIILLPLKGNVVTELNRLAVAVLSYAGILIIVIIFERALKRFILGGADIKAVFLACLYLPWTGFINMLVLSAILSIVLLIITVLISGRQKNREKYLFPYIPLLSISAITAYLASSPAVQ